MKVLVLTAFIAAVVSGVPSVDVDNQTQYPWQSGFHYRYDVVSHTMARHKEGQSSGSIFKAQFIIRVLAPGRLQAKLHEPKHALVHQELADGHEMPQDLKYQPVQKLDQVFEISLEGGRVRSLKLPAALPLSQENLLKGLIGALQVDLSTRRLIRSSQYSYDKEKHQGRFSKMETDVTGDCETVYDVSPAAAEWRRELPAFASKEDPIEITKSKNYGHCHHRVGYHFGVPEGAEWTGTAHDPRKDQFITRGTVSRILAGKQGPIYKAETTSTVNVHPHVFGEQKATVKSYILINLISFEKNSEEAWPQVEGGRLVRNLLYSVSIKQITMGDSSSSSSSSSSESQENHKKDQVVVDKDRVRRSLEKIENIDKVDDEDTSSSSSSSSDSLQDFVNDDLPRNNEPAYAALYMSPQSRNDKKQNTMNAQKLVQDIAQQLQNPNNMPKSDSLSKFSILVRILRSMTFDQISQTSRSIEAVKSSNNNVKYDMWMVFRDAVAQTGTLPASQLIQIWIQKKKIQGEEAAQVVASLPSSMRYPTKEFMIQFFNLALSDEVRQQSFLNTTALIAATRLINTAQVNNESAHNFYPSHMYGRLSHKHDPFVYTDILPRLSQELSQAIQQEDRNRAQVYIKAIGNLGHPSILKVFAPYLEGKITVTTYLRSQMVHNLDILAYQRDKLVRSALYNILKNAAEHYDVRVAAIHNILIARPTSSMMMVMAQMTHTDPSLHVRAALKSSIESAADLKNPHFLDLSRTAQAVKWMLSKQEYGVQYSTKDLEDSYDKDYELGFISSLSYTGSHDSLFPKFFKYSLRSKSHGWDKPNTISASFSSVQQYIEYFKYLMSHSHTTGAKSEVNHKYSAEKISKMLNFKEFSQVPFEGAFYVDFMNQPRYFTFTEYDLERLTKYMPQYFENLEKGVERHYTKVFNQAQVSVMFPVASGLPFIYKYQEPTIVHMQGKIKGKVQHPTEQNKHHSASISKEIHFTYARNLDGSVGFMDTLIDQYISTGIVNKLQLNVPIKLDMQMKSGEYKVSVEPLRPEQDQTILHYSVWPYTASQKKDSLTPVSQDKNTKQITRQYKVSSVDHKFGQSLGNVYQLQGYSYSSDYQNLGSIFQSDNWLSNIAYALYQKDVAMTHYNFKYLGKQSQNKRITFTAVYDTYHNLKEKAQQEFAASNTADVSPNSDARRQEIVKRVAAGIDNAKAKVVDMSVTFESSQQLQYVLTLAMANSPIDRKIQYGFFAGKNSQQQENNQINGILKVNKPEIISLNFLDALKKEMKTPFEAHIKFGQNGNGNIHVQGHTERTKKYAEQLQKHHLAKICKDDIANNNLYQYACHKAIVMAHAPDNIKVSVTYEEVSPAVTGMIYQAFNLLKHKYFWYSEVNPKKTIADGKLEIDAQFSYLENTMDLALNTRLGDIRMRNLPIPEATSRALAIYTPFKPWERVRNYYTNHQNKPFCTVDDNKVRTFSDRSYEYTLSPSWHVVMHHDHTAKDKLVVLARKPNEKQQDIYISYKSMNGKHLEVELQYDGQKYNVKVNTNGKKLAEGKITLYWDDVEDEPFLQYYTKSDGVMALTIRDERFSALYDGQRFVVLSNEHRNKNRGLCGYMSGSPRQDYNTPYGLVDRPEHYGAAYALKDENMDEKTKKLQDEAQKIAYQSKTHYTAILRSDSEWSNALQSSSSSSSSSSEEKETHNVYRSKSYAKERGECHVQHQVQYYENHGEICITNVPVASCQSHCRGVSYKIQSVQTICRPKIDQQFISYRDQIRQGENPKVSGVPQLKQFRVPTSCTA